MTKSRQRKSKQTKPRQRFLMAVPTLGEAEEPLFEFRDSPDAHDFTHKDWRWLIRHSKGFKAKPATTLRVVSVGDWSDEFRLCPDL